MAVTDEQLASVMSRLATLEASITSIQTVLTKKGSKQELRQTLQLREQEMNELTERLAVVETQITLINNTL